MRAWGTREELIGNLKGTHWEFKNPPPHSSLEEKKPSPLVHATLPHWLQEFILPICVLLPFLA